jgi:hypothetical protein
MMNICLRASAAGSAGYVSSQIQLHRPNNIALAAIGGGAMFVCTFNLKHRKKPKGRNS